jgi:hypothetical protein
LQGVQVTAIVISNSAQLLLNVSQVVNDGHALGELSNANHTSVTEKVSDSAVNIQTYLDNLQADAQITSIVVSNNVALTLTAAEVAHDGIALAEVSNKNGGAVSFNVLDTAANISTYLNQLASSSQFSKIASITVSDNASVALSVAQMTSDAAVLAKLVNQNASPYTLEVHDTGANLSLSEFDVLNGNSHVTGIVISDNGSVSLTVSEFTNDSRALGELSNANGQPYSIIIVDTASNIASDLSVLNGSSHVHKIVVSNSGSGGTITLSAAQASADSTALGQLYQANGTSPFLVNISDSSADFTTYLNALQGIVADLGTVTVTDYGQIGVNVAQVLADATILGKLQYVNGRVANLNLSDTASNISANIAALGANGHIQSVTVADNGVVTATYALYVQYNTLFYDIQGTHYLDITNVTGQAYSSYTETINGSHQVTLIDEYDSNGNLITQLNYLYNPDGTETITGTHIVGKPYASFVQNLDTQHRVSTATYYNPDGSVYDSQSFTYNQDGTTSESVTGLQGITLETFLIDAHGGIENEFVYYNNNSVTVYLQENGQTFTSNGELTGIKITSGTSGDTFNFTGHFGTMYISNYVAGSETINWDHNDFANIAAVEAHARQSGNGDTVITLDANDVITLTGVSLAQFEAHTSDWHFI